MLRKAIFTFFLLIGIGCGLLAGQHDDWGLRFVMMVIGATAGAVIGSALSNWGKKTRGFPLEADEELRPIPGGLGTSSRDRAANFWRDEGRMPFMKPPRPDGGVEPLDADKIP